MEQVTVADRVQASKASAPALADEHLTCFPSPAKVGEGK